MKLLDLFCGAGGAAKGYHRAGFNEIVGVDLAPQKRYPFTFVQGDALAYVAQHGHTFDVIHASPPCQAYSRTKSIGWDRDYPDLVGATRQALFATGRPYVIENVPGAPLLNPVMLCGAMFGLRVYRHRLFESNVFMLAPPHVSHRDKTPKAGTRGISAISPKGFMCVAGNFSNVDYARVAMGIDWMTRAELSQAIPPAYCQWIGERLLESMEVPA